MAFMDENLYNEVKGEHRVMAKQINSVKNSQTALRRNIANRSQTQSVKQVIKFTNNDVPSYLAQLDAFEERSNKVHLVVK